MNRQKRLARLLRRPQPLAARKAACIAVQRTDKPSWMVHSVRSRPVVHLINECRFCPYCSGKRECDAYVGESLMQSVAHTFEGGMVLLA